MVKHQRTDVPIFTLVHCATISGEVTLSRFVTFHSQLMLDMHNVHFYKMLKTVLCSHCRHCSRGH